VGLPQGGRALLAAVPTPASTASVWLVAVARPVGGSGTASVWLVAVAASAARRSVAALSLCIDAFIDLRSNSAYILSILFVNKKCPRYVCTNSNRFIHNPRREQEFSCVTFLDVNGSCRSTGTFSFL